MSSRRIDDRQYLQPEEFAATHGAAAADIAEVEAFAHEHGFDVTEVSPAERKVVLSGTVAAMSNAFGVQLERYEHPGGQFRGRTGPVHVPDRLAPIVEGVFGLDDRPQASPRLRLRPRTVDHSYTPREVAALYHFPAGATGQGQTIAIIELGGGYRSTELHRYFTELGGAAPRVTAVSVDGGHNQPGVDQNADGEVMLDIEVAGAVAPGARIAVYFGPNTDRGFLDAISRAIHDPVRRPSVVSISWGGPESDWTEQSLRTYDELFQEAATLGVTICCAAGDHGFSDVDPPDSTARADFPSSSPFALACGGTRLDGAGTNIESEVVWNNRDGWATGGGVSQFFPMPTWQQSAGVPTSLSAPHFAGRGLPDVAGNADGHTGYGVLVDGQHTVIGGTSAVAPLWAGLVALLNQQKGRRVGHLNPILYGGVGASAAFHDITRGDNDASGGGHGYAARPGWDACTGWGSPDGTSLLNAL